MALSDNLISYWAFDGDATDSEGSNDGSVTGATLATGKNNQCYSFDGNDYINAPMNNFDTYSVSFWFKSPVTIDSTEVSSWSEGRSLVSKDDTTNGFFSIFNKNDAGALRFGTNNGNIKSSKAVWTAGTWYHIVLVQETASQAYIYIDGALDNSGDNGYAGYDSTDIMIGAKHVSAPDKFFVGEIDEVAIWNRALSSTEASNLYNSGTGLFYNGTSFVAPTTSKIGQIDFQTPTGVESINVYNTGDVTNNFLQVQTPTGLGAINVVDAASADTPIQVMTPSGLMGVKKTI